MTSADALAPRLASLSAEHRQLEELLRAESRRPAPDFPYLAALKRRKLMIKDQIAALSRRTGAPGRGISA